MKTTMKLALMGAVALGAATTFTSCNKGGDEPARDEVKIVTSVAGMTRAPQLDETGEGVFSNGDTFGLLVMAADESEATKRFDYTVGTTKLYWDQMPPLAEGAFYNFLAVYPDVPEFIAEDSEVNFNAATAENPDLLLAGVSREKNETVQFTFFHVMHKLVVNLTSNYFSAEQLATAEVHPTLLSTARVNVLEGARPEGATTNNMGEYPIKTGANTSWIVAPQNLGTGTAMLSIWVGDYLMQYHVPASLTVLEGGKVTKLTLDRDRDAVTLEGDDVSQWGTETEVPGTIPVTE